MITIQTIRKYIEMIGLAFPLLFGFIFIIEYFERQKQYNLGKTWCVDFGIWCSEVINCKDCKDQEINNILGLKEV